MIKQYSELKGLTVEKVIFQGFGLAHYKDKTILIYQAITGDNVDVTIIHKRGDTYFGTINGYNSKSKDQIPVKCPHFDRCGGCDWLNISYETQLKLKQSIFEDEYSRYLSEIKTQSIIPSPKAVNYRNKIILPVKNENGNIKSGMYIRRSHDVIPHYECLLHPEGTEEIIRLTEERLTKANTTVYDEKSGKGNLRFIGVRFSETRKEYVLIIVTKTGKLPFSKILTDTISKQFKSVKGIVQDINNSGSNRNIGAKEKVLYGKNYITEDLPDISLRIHYSSFFQVNTGQCVNLLNKISSLADADDTVIDAYSGIGTFGLSLAKRVKKVICLEQHPQAVANGLFNIRENGLDNCYYLPGRVEDTLLPAINKHRADTIVFDPPRKGLDKSIIENISLSPIKKIIYVSCNISTQKRDLSLLSGYGFKLIELCPFDMFPQTHHIECLALLER